MCMIHNNTQTHHFETIHSAGAPGFRSLLDFPGKGMAGQVLQAVSGDTQVAASLSLWEIDPAFRCPVMGMCLDTAEQKQLLKKTGYSFKDKTLYEIHEILVSSADSENRLSQRIDRLLKRKFGSKAHEYNLLNDNQIMREWEKAFQSGDYPGEIWAVVTRRDFPESMRKKIFGDIHMAMHTHGESYALMRKNLSKSEEQLKANAVKMNELVASRRSVFKENQLFKKMIDASRCKNRPEAQEGVTGGGKCRFSEADSRQIEDLTMENRRILQSLTEMEARLSDKDRKIAALSDQIEKMEAEREERRKAESCLRKEAEMTMKQIADLDHCDKDCPSFDLCRKRVLIVGGIERMESLYRQMIESKGGVLEYHAGHMKGGGKHLENRLKRSDIVLCPVNCNSHGACALVKNLCKKHNKPVHMLSSFSLSTVSQVIKTCALEQVA